MKNIIFDFDGTIADSFDYILEMFEGWYPDKKHYSRKEIDGLKSMSIPMIAETLGINRWKLPFLVIKGRRQMSRQLDKIELIKGIDKVIEKLKQNNLNLFIASSNSTKNINEYLKSHNLDIYFSQVHGDISLFNKSNAIKKILDKNNLKPEETIYVGDEVRDIKAAKKAGIKICSVSYGFNSSELLELQKPDYLVNKSQDILKVILS